MQTVIIASTNPVKVTAVRHAFQRVFPGTEYEFIGVEVPSGVKDQPDSDTECLRGAMQRVFNSREQHPAAHYWVGIEAGIERRDGEMASFSWTVILSTEGRIGKATTGISFLPPAVIEHIEAGLELGEAMDRVFAQQHSKQKNGAVGLLTGNAVTRREVHENAVILALIPFKNPELYPIQAK
ncbi:MAG: inosine/xanthosine triphosphatase [Anaerolineae bacterium]|nr:inosine/xanthosine triphosphatase [Anaerolineae bacterium]